MLGMKGWWGGGEVVCDGGDEGAGVGDVLQEGRVGVEFGHGRGEFELWRGLLLESRFVRLPRRAAPSSPPPPHPGRLRTVRPLDVRKQHLYRPRIILRLGNVNASMHPTLSPSLSISSPLPRPPAPLLVSSAACTAALTTYTAHRRPHIHPELGLCRPQHAQCERHLFGIRHTTPSTRVVDNTATTPPTQCAASSRASAAPRRTAGCSTSAKLRSRSCSGMRCR